MDGHTVNPSVAKEIARKKRLAMAKLKQRQYQKTHVTKPTSSMNQPNGNGSVSRTLPVSSGSSKNALTGGQAYMPGQNSAAGQSYTSSSIVRPTPQDSRRPDHPQHQVQQHEQQSLHQSQYQQPQQHPRDGQTLQRQDNIGSTNYQRQQYSDRQTQRVPETHRPQSAPNTNGTRARDGDVVNLTGSGDGGGYTNMPHTTTAQAPPTHLHMPNTHISSGTSVGTGLPTNRDTHTPSNLVRDGTLNSFCKNKPEMPQIMHPVKVKVECELVDRGTVTFKPQSTLHAKFKQIMREEKGVYEPKKLYWKVPVANYLSAYCKLSQAHTFTIYGLPRFLHNKAVLTQLAQPEDTSTHSMDDTLLPPETLDKLLPFQREGIQWAIRRNGRALIADEMGLGKTVQAVCIACYYGIEWPALVVVPSSLRYQWREAFLKWVPVLRKSEINVIDNGKSELGNAGVNIITYDLISKFAVELKRRQFKVLILDECQKIKNPTAKRTMELLPLCKVAKRVLLLSGTPATSRPVELFTAMQAVRPEMFRNGLNEYGIRYCGAYKGPFGWNFDGQSRAEEIKTILKEFVMIRRLKSEVQDQLATLQSLTKKIRHRVNIDIDEKSKKYLADSMRKINHLNNKNFIEYFHETAVAKTPAVCDYIDRLLDQPVKFVVFCQHNEMMSELEYVMKRKDVDYIRIDGSTNSKARQKKAARFQEVPTCRVALLSLLAANAGLTLTASATVIFAELAWNPGDLLQAEDRVHRISQNKDVTIQYLHAPNTMDDVMWEKLNKKLGVLGKAGVGNQESTSSKRSAMDTENLMSTSQGVAVHSINGTISDTPTGENKPAHRRVKKAKTLIDFLGSPSKSKVKKAVEVSDDDNRDDLLDDDLDDECVFLDCS
ncbi:hypothetical protein SARC_10248 [Sphaeroforma arctica JP610]|uniref:SWI/SNF-related matrix-associated actin-dependent regulator of chromatin subfamily A-like protein 1 n=1 Tax=Sphaeroforma arctica JP610 TaxID=667725 RepID=A0A0L0FLB6_9EUKA|nr:hypothetical protein SARC_10248 [Sphaeroforma arctica JP610]KNC77281.1 hypothetical protein SARC_10248 [Sphaeroforma arctica JP610]|eukprot:XP_014151183.1 hypothetical protein SARC_10248 [Sphaeroforma arctica JP610]